MPNCCTSPQQQFFVRNDGDEPLANDTRATVTLPAGVISAPGLQQIRDYLHRTGFSGLAYSVPLLGDEWQTRDGNYPKRLSRLAYKNSEQLRLPPEVLSHIGCIARDHSKQASTAIEITRRLNLSSAAFGNRGSCWWGSGGYGYSRCAFKTNGGFGLRSFGDGNPEHNSNSYVTGRAWVLPLKLDQYRGDLTPTFATMTPDAFLVFNGYGELGGYTAPRILAHMTGWTYRKTGFACRQMYVNAGGYLVAPEDLVAQQLPAGSTLELSVERHASLFEREQAAATRAAEQQTADSLLACFSRHTGN